MDRILRPGDHISAALLFDLSKKEDEFGDLAWKKTCDWLLLAHVNLTQFQNDPVIG